MLGRREERRRLAEEEVERRNRINKQDKRSKSRDRAIMELKGITIINNKNLNIKIYLFYAFVIV